MKVLTSPRSMLHHCRPLKSHPSYTQTRSLFDFSDGNATTSTTRTFSATRRLSHAPRPLFNLICDIDSYSQFIPYCTDSLVTQRSSTPEKFPTRAQLSVGWHGLEESFVSELECSTKTSNGKELAGGEVIANAAENSIFSVLKTRWTIDEAEKEGSKTEEASQVRLEIGYKFINAFYATMSDAAMPQVAGKIIEAFEKRADDVLKAK